MMDFEAARRYALERMEKELPETLFYHSLFHTRDEVRVAAEQFGKWEKLSNEDMLLLLTAVYYHDLGFVVQSQGHEAISARLAAEFLPGFGYTPQQVHKIQGMIMATELPQTPHNLLEALMADADLDNLGQESFFKRSQDLRRELAVSGVVLSQEEWYSRQLRFMETHRYFTDAAITLRGAQKEQNILRLRVLVAQYQQQGGWIDDSASKRFRT
jgi:uncharacterized protein